MKQHQDFFLAACKCLGVYPEVISGSGRGQNTVAARRIIAHVMRERMQLSYPEIAEAMNPGRSHSSIITAVRAYRAKMENDPVYADLSQRVYAAIRECSGVGDARQKVPLVERLDFWMEFAKQYHREIDGDDADYSEPAMRGFADMLETSCRHAVKKCSNNQWLLAVADSTKKGTQTIRDAALSAAARVSSSMHTSLDELREHTKTHHRSRARHVLYYAMRFHFVDNGYRPSLEFIASVIANRDQSTVRYGVYKAKQKIDQGDEEWCEMADAAKRALLGEAQVEAQVELQEVAA